MKTSMADFREGAFDIFPVLVAACPIGLLWGTLAAGKGFSALETWLMSATVFAGASQFVAIELWKEPAAWVALAVTVFIVNIRHILMGASLSRTIRHIPLIWHPFMAFLMADEDWAFAERRALTQPLTPAYYFGMAIPMWVTWTTSSVIGAAVGRTLGDPAAFGFDFAFSALFIGILAGFWKGLRTGVVLATSAITAALAKLAVPGAWYIVAGGLAGVAVAALLHREGENA
jgi:4-azaleucine resistance transporter AzlC